MPGSSFTAAFEYILSVDGGYVNDPINPGVETKYGISKRAYPHLDIPDLTENDAREIYHLDYWRKAGCDNIPFALALALFDAAVDHGVHRGVMLFQQALGVRPDGIHGPVTRAYAQTADKQAVLMDLLVRRGLFYVDLTKANANRLRFLKGWLRRLFVLQQTILAHAGDDWEWEPRA